MSQEFLQSLQIFTASAGGMVVGLVAAVVLLAATTAFLRRGPDLPYTAAGALLTPAERAFYRTLRQAVGSDFLLFTKVRLGDILQVRPGIGRQRQLAALGRINSKHADFVLCDPRTFTILWVIELDDRSHQLPARRRRDEFFDAALARAEVPLLRVPVARTYSVQAPRDDLLAGV